MKRLNILIGLLLFATGSLAQTIITGKVIDKSTNQAIDFASIQTEDGNAVKPTMSNEEGSFTIEVKKLPAKLLFSHINYKKTIVTISDSNPVTVKLDTLILLLSEVNVSSNKALSIIQETFKKAAADTNKTHYFKAFTRQLSKYKDKYSTINEIFFDARYKNFGITGWMPQQARYGRTKDEFPLTNLSFLSFITTGYLPTSASITPIFKNTDERYDFKIKGYLNENTENEVAIIECNVKPQTINLWKDKMYFEGAYYINTTNFRISKIDGFVRNIQLESNGPVKLKLDDCPIAIAYTPSKKDGIMVLEYADFTISGKLMYAGVLGGGNVHYQSKVFFYQEDEELRNSAYQKITPKINDIEVSKTSGYDPKFWINNPVITRNAKEEEAIRLFEDQKLIGNYFEKP